MKNLFRSEQKAEERTIDPYNLSKDEDAIAGSIRNNIKINFDKKTAVISISIKDQDPLICKTIGDSVKERLQEFITDYRTRKARVDLEYNQKIYGEAKARYEQARNRYARFSDSNRDVLSQHTQTRKAELQNEMQLQQTIYQQVAAQVQQAEAKVQEETPAFTTLQSATVPVKKTGPKRAQICIIYLFLAFLATSIWILYKEDDLKSLLGLN